MPRLLKFMLLKVISNIRGYVFTLDAVSNMYTTAVQAQLLNNRTQTVV
jgi:hypothetical protein